MRLYDPGTGIHQPGQPQGGRCGAHGRARSASRAGPARGRPRRGAPGKYLRRPRRRDSTDAHGLHALRFEPLEPRFRRCQYSRQQQKHRHRQNPGPVRKVDVCGKKFVQKFGKEKLYQVAKLHFKNTQKIGV